MQRVFGIANANITAIQRVIAFARLLKKGIDNRPADIAIQRIRQLGRLSIEERGVGLKSNSVFTRYALQRIFY